MNSNDKLDAAVTAAMDQGYEGLGMGDFLDSEHMRIAILAADAILHPPADKQDWLTRQQVMDRFGFLDGFINGNTLTTIVSAVMDMQGELAANGAAPAPSVPDEAVVTGWLHEIQYTDGWSSPAYVHGPKKPLPHVQQCPENVRHIVASTVVSERFTPVYTRPQTEPDPSDR
jgi:hypothetical protein